MSATGRPGSDHRYVLLGQATGSRMATDLELYACFEAWAKESDRVALFALLQHCDIEAQTSHITGLRFASLCS